jgi:hypothetical protein
MAKVLGFNPTQTNDYFELANRVELQQKLIEELIKLNEGYEAEVKRLVGEYDKMYELLKYYDPMLFGYSEAVDADLMKRISNRRGTSGVEFIDFSKPKADEQV